MTRFESVSILTLLTAALAAQGPDAQAPANDKTVVELASEAGSFTTLVAAVKAAGLAETLSGKGPFTVFAPTDAAFAKLGKKTIDSLLEPKNKDQLVSILTYHVAGANLPAKKVVGMKLIPTLQGCDLGITVDGDSVLVGGAKVVKTDIVGSNGVIHVIDAVLTPPPVAENLVAAAKAAGNFQTLLTAAKAAGLADTLAKDGPFTIFAPTDAAFAKLGDETIANLLKPENKAQLADILKFHVVSGKVPAAQALGLKQATTLLGQQLQLAVADGKLTVNGANVIATDVLARNGVIHVIDAVLLPRK